VTEPAPKQYLLSCNDDLREELQAIVIEALPEGWTLGAVSYHIEFPTGRHRINLAVFSPTSERRHMLIIIDDLRWSEVMPEWRKAAKYIASASFPA